MVRLPAPSAAVPSLLLLSACAAIQLSQPATAFIHPLLRRPRPTPTRMVATTSGGGGSSGGSSPPASIFIVTGSTDGIGQHTASNLALTPGNKVFVHGRNPTKVQATVEALRVPPFPGAGDVEGFVADLGSLKDVRRLAQEMNDRCVLWLGSEPFGVMGWKGRQLEYNPNVAPHSLPCTHPCTNQTIREQDREDQRPRRARGAG